jgi:hypothetical protein
LYISLGFVAIKPQTCSGFSPAFATCFTLACAIVAYFAVANKGRATCRLKYNNGVPIRTVLKTGGQTSLRAEIYRPIAVYLRLLALLVATYLGTAQCHDYSDKQNATKEGEGEHRHAKINVLVSTWWIGRTGRGACGCRGRLVLMLATAK